MQLQLQLLKLQMLSSDAAGDHVVGFNFYGKNSTAQAISATITLGTTAATSDLTNLKMQLIPGYSSTTGIRATLNANKKHYCSQDEGEDIVIENVDFATVGKTC